MKLVFDENLPPALPAALALNEQSVTFAHTIDLVGPGASDEEIFRVLAADRKAVLVTLDIRQTRTPHVRKALEDSGITVVYLVDGWADIANLTRLELFVRWFPKIVEAMASYERGAWFEVPKSRHLKPLKPMPQSRSRRRDKRKSSLLKDEQV
ncbi:DUF5615 family PIN-like protein [Caulobacter sp. RL271]|uniref:DUF5615 family PIN-like protein n=1 Tax=Caulobacter segnis TaxID=88688 RepID=A0ABY4ZTB2_9CAUL|nr:DUF5615 family PIN-like protein [Caulobacter segnis]USQ95833.1 DUF5615 family PIN-like protein [Caulobacter segnis]